MKPSSLREQTDEELKSLLDETDKELRGLKVKHKTGEGADHPLRVRLLRRDKARINTVLREREISKGASHG
jgi:large subunit ribosomal protein L29